jgi:hypothetical protein
MKKFEEAFNNMTRALFTLDAVQVVDWEGRGTFSGHQAIEKWFAVKFALKSRRIRRQACSGFCSYCWRLPGAQKVGAVRYQMRGEPMRISQDCVGEQTQAVSLVELR